MGQPVRVSEKISATNPGTVRYETNRPLTGMGHRYYRSADDVKNVEDPADVLAGRLFDRGGVDSLHVYGNVATVDITKGHDSEGIVEIVTNLFTHYGE
ncbi:MAG: hypothetical protein ACI85J_000018 [Candidatus Poriferisodalaceae bacterium]|jgi:hypothetical protein|tara:strand:+ start:2248 stop:2541 length:294 start_codon:yes stop_codon:yes gene_type:complete